jgi:hypothetical protein
MKDRTVKQVMYRGGLRRVKEEGRGGLRRVNEEGKGW